MNTGIARVKTNRCDVIKKTSLNVKVKFPPPVISIRYPILQAYIESERDRWGSTGLNKKMVRTRTSTSDIPVLTPNGWICKCICIRGVGVVTLVRASMCMCTYATMHTVRYT